MNKKIVHVIIGLHIGGAELMLKRLVLSSNKKEEFQHIVISLMDLGVIGPDLQKQGVEVYSLGMRSALSIPKIFLRLRQLLKKLNPDVVQTWMYHADFLGGLAAKSIGVKNIIWGIRTTDVSQGSSKITVHLSKLCAKLSYHVPTTIVCAAHVAKDYHVGIGYDESKMTVIANGYEIDALTATDADGLDIRQQHGISADDIVIGSVGRFNPVKNQKLFVDVAAILVKDYPNIKFMMVGRDNTAENKELLSWIEDYGLTDNFRLLGERGDVPKCLKAMDVFCLHSKTEGFPNVVVEAILLNVFTIATDVGEVARLIPEEQIVSVDKNDYSTKLQHVLSSECFRDKEKLNALKESSIAKYSIANIVLEHESIYEKI